MNDDDRQWSADRKVELVGQSYDPEYTSLCLMVEVTDRGKTRLFRQYFDVETVLYEGAELVLKKV